MVPITRDTALVVVFGKSMNPSTLVLTGNMTSESDGGIWVSRTTRNDTLVLTPQGRWSPGSSRMVKVECRDSEGFTAQKVAGNFGVLDGKVFVHVLKGSDDFPGTAEHPKRRIQPAIDLASSLYGQSEVLVAEGEYLIRDSDYGPDGIIMRNGVNLYGGYSRDSWGIRNPELHTTAITQYHNEASSSVVSFQDIPQRTVLDGFSLRFLQDSITCDSKTIGIRCENSTATISRNLISFYRFDSIGVSVSGGSLMILENRIQGFLSKLLTGIEADNAANMEIVGNEIVLSSTKLSTGIRIIQSEAIVTSNRILPTSTIDSIGIEIGDSLSFLKENEILCESAWKQKGAQTGIIWNSSSGEFEGNAIFLSNAEMGTGMELTDSTKLLVFNNLIMYGNANLNKGIRVVSSEAHIANNLIFGGSLGGLLESGSPVCVTLENGARIMIDNNIFIAESPTSSIGILQKSTDSTPLTMRNNLFFNCVDGAFILEWIDWACTNPSSASVVTYLEAFGMTAIMLEGNISGLDPILKFTDYDYTRTSPLEVTEGGLDLSTKFLVDRNRRPRTVPWSIGPYEKD
jgi:hypothetical protein